MHMNNDKSLKHKTDADRSISTLIDAISGGISNPKHLVKEVGSMIKASLQGQFMEGFLDSWTRLAEKGRVTPDYINTPHGLANFREILKVLELDDTDQARFEAVQNIFLNDAISIDDNNEVLVIRLLKIASILNAGEILILKVMSEDATLSSDRNLNDTWEDKLAMATGLKHRELIEQDVLSLKSKKLISGEGKVIATDEGVGAQAPRLSTLGQELCGYIKNPIDASNN